MKQINQLPEATTANNDDVLAIQNNSGTTKKITREKFLEGISSSGSNAIIPSSFTYWHDEAIIVSGNQLNIVLNPSVYRYGYGAYQNPPSINDSFKFYRLLDSGNYRLHFLCNRANELGTLKLEVNDSQLFDDLDLYNSSVIFSTVLTKDINLANAGLQEFKFTVSSKNVNSRNYYATFTKIWAIKL